MISEEMEIKVETLKKQIEDLKANIEKVNSEIKNMTREVRTMTCDVNDMTHDLKLMLHRAGKRYIINEKSNEVRTYSKQDLSENLSTLLSTPIYTFGGFTFDVNKRMLTYQGVITRLTAKEAYLLVMFAGNANVLLDRTYLLTSIWEDDNYLNSRSMDVYICKLRKILSKDPNVELVNKHGKGYIMLVR